MRIFSVAVLSALAFAASPAGLTTADAQSAPVQTEQMPQQADQSRAQDRGRAEGMKIDRDWKAEERANDRAAPAAADKDKQTVGRDWRAHPDAKDR